MAGRFPNFLVIGAAKSGTSALYQYLKQHPDIFMCPIKEPHYFAFAGLPSPGLVAPDGRKLTINEKAVTAPAEYERLYEDWTEEKMGGECSVSTLHFPGHAIPAIKDADPHMKLVVLLRHPVARAYSSYTHVRRWGIETHTRFADALAAEDERMEGNPPLLFRYRNMSLYYRQLRPFFDAFPTEQIHVMLYDDYVGHRLPTLQGLYRFLGVDGSFEPDLDVRSNVSVVPNMKNPVHRALNHHNWVKRLLHNLLPWRYRRGVGYAIKKRLFKRPEPLSNEEWNSILPLFVEDLLQLQALLDRDLSHWLRPRS